MIHAVLDTNVLASGFVRPEPVPGQLLLLWQAEKYILVVSEHILTELARTFEEPYFARHLTPEQRASNVALLRREALVVPLTARVSGIATHPEDDRILATAVSAHADYPVTGDAQLQKLGEYEDVKIVSPRQFLELLGEEDQQA